MSDQPLSARLQDMWERGCLLPDSTPAGRVVRAEILNLLPAVIAKLEEAEQYVAIQRMEIDHG